MRCVIKFDCDNASFGESQTERIAEIISVLDDLVQRLKTGHHDSTARENFMRLRVGTRLRDSNGNSIGYAWLEK